MYFVGGGAIHSVYFSGDSSAGHLGLRGRRVPQFSLYKDWRESLGSWAAGRPMNICRPETSEILVMASRASSDSAGLSTACFP